MSGRGIRPHRQALCKATGLPCPLPRGSFSAAIGDGSLSALSYPDGLSPAYRASSPRCCARAAGGPAPVQDARSTANPLPRFCAAARPARSATSTSSNGASPWRWLRHPAIPTLPSVESSPTSSRNSPTGKIWPPSTGWPMAQIDTIDVYRGSPEVYSFRHLRADTPDDARQFHQSPADRQRQLRTGRAMPAARHGPADHEYPTP